MSALRCFVGVVAFGFAAMWITASLAAALVCLAAAVVAYGVVVAAERTRARLAKRKKRVGAGQTIVTLAPPSVKPEDLPSWADALNTDLGHIYEPAATTSPLARDAEYGWPLVDDTVVSREPLH